MSIFGDEYWLAEFNRKAAIIKNRLRHPEVINLLVNEHLGTLTQKKITNSGRDTQCAIIIYPTVLSIERKLDNRKESPPIIKYRSLRVMLNFFNPSFAVISSVKDDLMMCVFIATEGRAKDEINIHGITHILTFKDETIARLPLPINVS